MPIYMGEGSLTPSDGVWYPNGNTPLNQSAISAAQATNIGNQLESIGNQLPIKVQNEAERNERFPEPKLGDCVYRIDLGREERYYTRYSVKDNIGGKPYDGWYLVNSGQNATLLDSYYELDGSTIGLTVNNVLTSDFNFWRVTYNLQSVLTGSGTTGLPRFRFALNGIVNASTNYSSTQLGNNSSAPVSRALSGNSFIPLSYETFGAAQIHSGSILISGIASGNYPKIVAQNYSSNPSICETSGYYNSTSAGFNGFRIYASANNLNGVITVKGYN